MHWYTYVVFLDSKIHYFIFWLVAAIVIGVTCNRWHNSQSIKCCWGDKVMCNGNDTRKLVPQRRLYTVMGTIWVWHVAVPIKVTDNWYGWWHTQSATSLESGADFENGWTDISDYRRVNWPSTRREDVAEHILEKRYVTSKIQPLHCSCPSDLYTITSVNAWAEFCRNRIYKMLMSWWERCIIHLGNYVKT